MHDTTAPWAKASPLLALSFSEILDEEGIDFEEFESRAIAFGHAAIAEAISLSLERKDASLCAALGDGLAVHDQRPKTLASEIGDPKKPRADASKAGIDHERVSAEMGRPGVTTSLLWSEYCERALALGKEPCMYSAFCQKHREWAAANKAVMRIERKPAQEMQVDYVGGTMEVLDPDTGELPKVYAFAACLPYSGELYAEGFYDMKEESWVAAHVRAFSFYGGSVPIIVPDNLKQGISKNTFDELVVNDRYRRMAEYYGCAVVPARPRKPRDEGAVETGARVIEQRAVAPPRDRLFTSLSQLNGALLEKVREINARPFQQLDGSRDEAFARQEKPLLVPLPAKPCEMVSRKAAVDAILGSRKVEQQSYRSRRGVMALAKRHGGRALEQACAKALSYTPRPSCPTANGCATTGTC